MWIKIKKKNSYHDNNEDIKNYNNDDNDNNMMAIVMLIIRMKMGIMNNYTIIIITIKVIGVKEFICHSMLFLFLKLCQSYFFLKWFSSYLRIRLLHYEVTVNWITLFFIITFYSSIDFQSVGTDLSISIFLCFITVNRQLCNTLLQERFRHILRYVCDILRFLLILIIIHLY